MAFQRCGKDETQRRCRFQPFAVVAETPCKFILRIGRDHCYRAGPVGFLHCRQESLGCFFGSIDFLGLILAVGGCTRRDHSEAEDQRQKNFADHGKSLPQ